MSQQSLSYAFLVQEEVAGQSHDKSFYQGMLLQYQSFQGQLATTRPAFLIASAPRLQTDAADTSGVFAEGRGLAAVTCVVEQDYQNLSSSSNSSAGQDEGRGTVTNWLVSKAASSGNSTTGSGRPELAAGLLELLSPAPGSAGDVRGLQVGPDGRLMMAHQILLPCDSLESKSLTACN
jgi:hypothetical protein